MAEWQPLTKKQHAEAYYRPRWDFNHARERSVVPAMLGELSKLIPHYVIAFIKDGDAFRPMAVLAAPNQMSLYLKANGQWDAPYVPASLRAHPFSLLRSQDGNNVMLAVDTESLREADEGEPLFDDDGNLTDGVQRAFDFLSKMEGQRQLTEKAADLLQAANVIHPWPLTLPAGDEKVTIKGLYCVDEQALNALDIETYATLQGAPMQLAYAQLYSMAQLDQLTQRATQYAQQNQQAPVPDIEQFFGDKDADMFKF